MPRELVVGNGKLLVNIDKDLQVRDIYFPFVGHQNHVQGHPNRIGVSIDDTFYWLNSENWTIQTNYHQDSLITNSLAVLPEQQIAIRVEEGVHQREMVFMRKFSVENLANDHRHIKLFFHQDLAIYENEVGDTAFFSPKDRTMIHYKRNRYFLFNGSLGDSGIKQYTTGVKRFHEQEGTFRDAEDGQLHFNPIAQGSVDSTFSLEGELEPNSTQEAYYWMTVGKSLKEVQALNDYVMETGRQQTLDKIHTYWKSWVNKGEVLTANLSPEMMDLYKRSLLVVRTQTNENGYIIAANDSDILQYNQDHYSYMWPRDGALIAQAMVKAGYHGMVRNFFRRCSEVLSDDGYLFHKYNPDGSIGSSWHPLVGESGEEQLPIQEDETALVLWAFWEDYEATGDIEFAQSLYRPLVRPSAEFILSFIDEQLNLPSPSYDLWEERRGIFTFTASTVYGGLVAASRFANLLGEKESAERYAQGAKRIKEGVEKYLFDENTGTFFRGIYKDETTDEITVDQTPESSLYGLFAFGMYDAKDKKVDQTMTAISEQLRVNTNVGGYARYSNDNYFKQTEDIHEVPGNPWIICTLWVAKWHILKAVSIEELQPAYEIFQWVCEHSLSSGLLPEQIHPHTGEPLSVAPLTWSHATFIDVVNDYNQAFKRLSYKV
ncbi:glycoside hydrolase family 15 protein [Alkalihalobacterium chitinilyticum]|uniref:Glycoside hydrolase family 15 protein n=1 Tax=Alkalihalobacterium chitinilyticum TaxID=2980103 RepID=A0ABT5VER1_9BACI|nr:glycoside hydrolase family 15 protein [Alkalihalobacterium chitinilyticum]MDE5413946.1 glycoside hydrolase family 15 protein [Alkalihalobacterium chitinilyticum]